MTRPITPVRKRLVPRLANTEGRVRHLEVNSPPVTPGGTGLSTIGSFNLTHVGFEAGGGSVFVPLGFVHADGAVSGAVSLNDATHVFGLTPPAGMTIFIVHTYVSLVITPVGVYTPPLKYTLNGFARNDILIWPDSGGSANISFDLGGLPQFSYFLQVPSGGNMNQHNYTAHVQGYVFGS